MKKQITLLFSLVCAGIIARSVHRPPEVLPTIHAQWIHGGPITTVKDSHLEYFPHFVFDYSQLIQYSLPEDKIFHRNDPEKWAATQELNQLIEQLVCEVFNKKRKFSHFTVLQTKNFSFKYTCGLIVLKFKDYPFVLKLFIESPDTYLNPLCKGIEPIAFFTMGGGANRHLSGLTRIPNLEYVKNKLEKSERWNGVIEFPRKWFWLPKDPRWIQLTGENLGNKKKCTTKMPGVYAIIAEYIDMQHTISLSTLEKKRIVIDLCNDVNTYLDPHYTNFTFVQDETKPFKIVIIDTEHFPSFVGLKKRKQFRNHSSWYEYLMAKGMKDMFFRNKQERKEAQITEHELSLF